MHFVATVVLLAASVARLASAGDVCPGTYCNQGGRCEYDPNGPHCCSGTNSRDVLQCEGGKWVFRNACNTNQFCTCTGSHDLVCRNRNLAEAEFQS